ncbi:MAG: hypothetical protein R3D58_14825 [Saprospiraceae bacterium]
MFRYGKKEGAMDSNTNLPESVLPLHVVHGEFDKLAQPGVPSNYQNSLLACMLKTAQELNDRKMQTIRFSQPLINLNGQGVIFPQTINVLQGQSGVHKSRVAGMFASLLLNRRNTAAGTLGFELEFESDSVVCYMDTERNLNDQLPYALQCIQVNAGFDIQDQLDHFVFTSLLEFRREERISALETYLAYLRDQFTQHIFIILDVVSDCVSDFNRTEDSMRLIDMLNVMVNRYNATFLCVIHENPNQQKARGHLGTELFNKATTAIQLAAEQDSEGTPSDIIRLKFIKCRNTKAPLPVYARIDPDTRLLVEANQEEIQEMRLERQRKASETEVLEFLEGLAIDQPYTKTDLLKQLSLQFEASDKILGQRLDEITATARTFYVQGHICILQKNRNRQTYYTIKIQPQNEELPISTGQ